MIVRPIAVTVCQNCAASALISCTAEAVASTIRVVSDGLDIRIPVSVAVPDRAPIARSKTAVTSALITSTATTAIRIEFHCSSTMARSRLIPTVIRKTPSARPLKGSVIRATSV